MTYTTKVRTLFLYAMVLTLTLTGVAIGGQEQPRLEAADEILSLDLTDVPVRAVFEAIGEVGRLQFLFDEKFDPGARTSVHLSDVSVLDALRFVARSNELFFVVRDAQAVLIAPDTWQKRQQHMPRGTRTFQLEHADPKTVIVVLRSLLQTRQVVHDEQLNTVTMQDTFDLLDIAEELVERLDRENGESAGDRDLLWVGTEYSHDLRSKGDTIPSLEVDLEQKVTLELADAIVRQVYETLARSSGIQFLLNRRIDPGRRVSVNLQDVSVRDALRDVNEQLGFFSVVLGPRTVLVAPDTDVKRATEEHVGIQFFYLSHADTRTVVTAVRSLLKVRQIAVIPHLNAVVLGGTISQLQAAQELVEETDRPAAQAAAAG